MRAFARQGVEINGERADEGFAFACAHFGDFAVVQHHAADELNVKMAHAQHAHGGFAAHGECFGQDVVKRFTIGETLFEFCGFGLQLFVAEGFNLVFQAVDFGDDFSVMFEQAVVAAAEDFFGDFG